MGVADGLVLAGGGFLLAVLWMDLIFDVQARGAVSETTLTSISAYYRRATTTSQPMSKLIAAVMAILLGALVFRAVAGSGPLWLDVASLVLAAIPIVLALVRTVPNAIRLGATGTDETAAASRLARSVLRDHVVCFVCVTAFLALRLIGSAVV
jgi:hypothetical protein